MKTIQNSKFKIKNSAIFTLATLLLPAAAFAAGSDMIQMTTMDWVWKIVNFAVLVGLLYMFGWKVIRDHLKQRRELIEKSISESREAKELAVKALAEVEERLKLKDKEVSDIIAAAVESGEREKVRLVEEGEKMKIKIIEQARSNIDFEMKKAMEAIQAEAVETSLRLAEEKIRSRMTKKEQERLIAESIKLIEGKN